MHVRSRSLALWCGPATIVLFVVGLWFVAGLVPPPAPDDSAEEIARMYRDDQDRIQVGLVLMMLASALIAPFVAAISAQLRRIEGPDGQLASIQYGLGVAGIFVILIPVMIMQAAAYRPDRDPDTILAMNDAAWLFFVGVISLFMVQCAAIAVCVFEDENQAVFPRWVGYFNLWAALLLAPATIIYFVDSGPFAWNGVLVFWVGLTVLGLWFAVMSVVVRSAMLREPDRAARV